MAHLSSPEYSLSLLFQGLVALSDNVPRVADARKKP